MKAQQLKEKLCSLLIRNEDGQVIDGSGDFWAKGSNSVRS